MQSYEDEDQGSDQDEYEESQFNNGRGLAIALSFLALPPPPKASTKRRANPKAIIENHLFYIHENESLTNLLDKAINSISSQGQPLLYGIGNHTGSLSPNNFTVKYTITRTEYKDISIESLQDHSTLIDTIKELSRPTGGFKLIITEFKEPTDGDEDEIKENLDAERAQKKKNPDPTPEEELQNETIALLQ
ncbi:hypothetical protein FIBSPDRAFT_950176 [Athelia psychrophila]|uniref:Uncharacterized protein n=1 Tax=Athelia psychrophila TaxID=1759441 RepID=A0A166NXC1_9AGAM|nr:hypothetical protein FIBSPDRAFT_950176 [Fibularhizoctonia sp. CBS 109695]